jgi:hypothetical protein
MRNATGGTTLLLLAIAWGQATAQPIYRCTSGDAVVFQDRACAAGGERLALEPVEAAPVPDAVQALVAAYEKRRNASRSVRVPSAGRTPAERPAYRCTSGDGRIDYLDRPCQAPRATKGRPVPTVVEQRITRREACEGRHALLDPYEREKRGAPSCR